jgi:alpha-L-fucosidase
LFGPEAGSFSATERDKAGKPKFVPKWNWRSTTANHRIYIELFTWPGGDFHLDRVPRNVTGAFLLSDASKKPLRVTKSASGVDIELPSQATDTIATVLVLETT